MRKLRPLKLYELKLPKGGIKGKDGSRTDAENAERADRLARRASAEPMTPRTGKLNKGARRLSRANRLARIAARFGEKEEGATEEELRGDSRARREELRDLNNRKK